MKNKVLNLTYTSSLTDLCEVNSSFDSGVLRIAYPGVNRNGSSISKEAFEKSIKTIFNCPIVCNYDRESDTLGGHDMEVVRSADGRLVIVNTTTPVGCIPESSRIFWEEVTECDGTTREYLCAEALLWKRQEAYKKIKEDGIVAHSMEITVKDGETRDGIYYINDFEFTAFALIGVEPCFESSSLELFSQQDFKKQLAEMMSELKESYNLVNTSDIEDDDKSHQHLTEGGEQRLNKNEVIAKYGIDVDALDFSIDDFTVEELEEKFKAMAHSEPHPTGDDVAEDKFALLSNITSEVVDALGQEKIHSEWGDYPRYIYADLDMDASIVYCWDSCDWLLYGFTYAMDGDNVIIDFDSKKRKKYVIEDFDEGEQSSPFAQVFEMLTQYLSDDSKWQTKYQQATATIATMNDELKTLREFKSNTEAAAALNEREEVFAQFEDLAGVEAFEALRDDCAKYDIETLEEKCYAIRGRQVQTSAKFSLEPKAPKIKIDKNEQRNTPYGGLFEKYGFSAEN